MAAAGGQEKGVWEVVSSAEDAVAGLDRMAYGLQSVDGFVCILQNCRREKKLACAKRLHVHMCRAGLEAHPALGNHLVPTFVECGSLCHAQHIFNRLVHRNEYSWTSIIQGYIHSGEIEHAFNLYSNLQEASVSPSRHTYICLLKACARLNLRDRALTLHTDIVKTGCEADVFVGSTLVDVYAKCNSFPEARQVFEELPDRNVVSWNALITGYAEHKHAEEALDCLEQLQLEGISANAVTYICSLKACSSICALDRGRRLHSEIVGQGHEEDQLVGSTLMDMYAKCGSLLEAQDVFDGLRVQDVVSWNSLIAGYAEYGFNEKALNCLQQMQLEGFSPDAATLVCSLKACGSSGDIERGQEIHAGAAKNGYEHNCLVGSTLVDMYAKCGFLAEAWDVFGKLTARDVVSWTALIRGYAEHGLDEQAVNCLKQMQLNGLSPDSVAFVCCLKACSNAGNLHRGLGIHFEIAKEGYERDAFVGNTLVDMYAKCSSLVEAQEVFNELSVQGVVSWNVLIAGYTEHGLFEEAINCLNQMQLGGMSPDHATLVYSLKACGSLGAIHRGHVIHAQIIKQGYDKGGVDTYVEFNSVTEVNLASATIDMYGKCGSMVDAQHTFNEMYTRDVVAWNALIAGYAHQGETELVFFLYERMKEVGVQPDGVTFVSVVTACSHVGLVEKGHEFFEAMDKEYDITPNVKHYNCMVDLLGRAGRLDEAVDRVDNMLVQPDLALWSTVLGACQKWGDVELGRQAFECAVRLDETNAPAFVLMSNVLASGRMSRP